MRIRKVYFCPIGRMVRVRASGTSATLQQTVGQLEPPVSVTLQGNRINHPLHSPIQIYGLVLVRIRAAGE